MRTLRVRRDVGANGYTAALRAATVQVRGAVKMRENDIGEGAGNPTLARNAIPGLARDLAPNPPAKGGIGRTRTAEGDGRVQAPRAGGERVTRPPRDRVL